MLDISKCKHFTRKIKKLVVSGVLYRFMLFFAIGLIRYPVKSRLG